MMWFSRLALTGCLADLENPEMSLVDPENAEFHMMLCPRP